MLSVTSAERKFRGGLGELVGDATRRVMRTARPGGFIFGLILDRILTDFGPTLDHMSTAFGHKLKFILRTFSFCVGINLCKIIPCIGMVLAQVAFGGRTLDDVGI